MRVALLIGHEAATFIVDRKAVLVEDVIVLKHVFTSIEVMTLNTLLSLFKSIGHHATLDWHGFFDA